MCHVSSFSTIIFFPGRFFSDGWFFFFPRRWWSEDDRKFLLNFFPFLNSFLTHAKPAHTRCSETLQIFADVCKCVAFTFMCCYIYILHNILYIWYVYIRYIYSIHMYTFTRCRFSPLHTLAFLIKIATRTATHCSAHCNTNDADSRRYMQ